MSPKNDLCPVCQRTFSSTRHRFIGVPPWCRICGQTAHWHCTAMFVLNREEMECCDAPACLMGMRLLGGQRVE